MCIRDSRVSGMTPELWHSETGERRSLPNFIDRGDKTTIPLQFEAHESYFVVFGKDDKGFPSNGKNFQTFNDVKLIDGEWSVSFDPERGGPENIIFESLVDWKDHTEPGVKHYSGKATYTKTFDVQAEIKPKDNYFIELGPTYEMARVTLNGEDLGTVWTSPWLSLIHI